MLLRRLVDLAGTLPADTIPPPFHVQTRVSWLVDLDAQGRLVTGEMARLAEPGDPSGFRGLAVIAPSTGRTSAVAPLLACDKIEYALGWPDPSAQGNAKAVQRAARYHEAFTDLVGSWADEQPDALVPRALHTFLVSDGAAAIPRPERYNPGDNVMFRVDGRIAHQVPGAAEFWASVIRQRKASGHSGRCLLCERDVPLLKRATRAVRPGLVPSQGYDPLSKTEHKRGNAASMVSVNAPSHGFDLQEGLTHTPLCEGCTESYTAALEYLLTQPSHRRTIGDTAFIWWVAPAQSDNLKPTAADRAPVSLLFHPDPATIADMLDAPRKGKAVSQGSARTDHFCAATLSNNSARIVVRDWIDVPLPRAEAFIAGWFADMKTTDPWTGQRYFPSLYRLLLALGRWYPAKGDGGRGSYPELGAKGARRPVWAQRELLLAAVNGTRLSPAMLAHLVLRIRADGHFDLSRQALLHLCLSRSHPNHAQELPMALDPTDDTPAYLAGRLFAVLESLQLAAARADGGKLNTTMADRYFNRSVTNPASVLIPAVGKSGAHLKKLRTYGKESTASFFATRINELMDRLKPFPTALTLTNQGLFLNGYAAQRNDDIGRLRARTASAAVPAPKVPRDEQELAEAVAEDMRAPLEMQRSDEHITNPSED